MLSVSRARLSMPETLPWVREELTSRLRPNGTLTLNRNEPRFGFNSFGHYTEQFAASLAINELLLQSVADVVRVFPAWPLDKPAHFRRLRPRADSLSRRRVSMERWGRFGSNRPPVSACVCSALGQQSKSLGPRVEPDP